MHENKQKRITGRRDGEQAVGNAPITTAQRLPPNSALQGDGKAAQALSRGRAAPNSALHNAAPSASGLPAALRARFETHTGVSLEGVRVHTGSPKPETLGALAYAKGDDIYLGPGQEEYLAHELGHVVQQRQGLVRPTGSVGGVSVNRDPSLEAGADAVLSHAGAGVHTGPGLSGPPVAQLQPDLSNVAPLGKSSTSKLRQGMDRTFRMFVDLENDLSLRRQIAQAQAFASPFERGSPERIEALMRYVQLALHVDEGQRDAVYGPTGENCPPEMGFPGGLPIHAASLGYSLDRASACRELSAFMQILLAQEGIVTHMKIGGHGRGQSNRHAWLTTERGDIIDPTDGRIYADPGGSLDHVYMPDTRFQPENFAAPHRQVPHDLAKVEKRLNWQSKPWAPSKTTGLWLFKKRTEPGASNKLATAALNVKRQEMARESIPEVEGLNRLIEQDPFLLQLESEGVFSRAYMFSRLAHTPHALSASSAASSTDQSTREGLAAAFRLQLGQLQRIRQSKK